MFLLILVSDTVVTAISLLVESEHVLSRNGNESLFIKY